MRLIKSTSLIALLFLTIVNIDSVFAQTQKQRIAIDNVHSLMTEAGNLYTQKKYKECVEAIKKVQSDIEVLSATGNPQIIRALGKPYNQLKRAHALLELEGYSLPALKPLNSPKGNPGTPTNTTSFTKTVAPMLVSNCGRCHVNRAQGKFSMATFPALMQGPNNNRVIFPGDAVGSRIVEVIEDGEMPPNGKVKAEDLALLKKWIAEGAKFDGENVAAPLNDLAKAANPSANPMGEAKVVKSTGKETVSFALEIAPVFIQNCNGCHYDIQNNARGGLNLSTFRQIISGGDSGQMIVPGKPAESLLVKKIKGEMGTRMPAGRAPLTSEVIAKIEKWIEEGATFDAKSEREDIRPIYELAKATHSSHEELMAERMVASLQNWKLFMPGSTANKIEPDDFVIFGDLSEAVLKDYVKIAEKVSPKIRRTFMGKTGPIVKGRVTLYLFKQRYDYSEFGKMVEKRDISRNLKGHFRYDVINAYGAMILPRDDKDYSEEAMFAQQIAGVMVASMGKNTPTWFAEGAARAAAHMVDPKDPRITGWKEKWNSVYAKLQKGDEFVKGQLPPEDSALASFVFVQNLMKQKTPFNRLVKALREGYDFEEAFKVIFGGTPSEAAKKIMGKAR
ncbi:MAG: c-type cytochrome domain-containing protein [Planctomycetota bacterium]|nr:c-type cytochrome domain-containing protein [Planctomycetota bacterium]